MPDRNKSAYAQAGVDIDAKMHALELMSEDVRSTYGPEVLGGMGRFGGLYSAARLTEMKRPVLVSSTDSVGTKTTVAAGAGYYRGLGQDIVNHSINDILVQGAEPLFFLDYLAAPRLHPAVIADLVSGMAEACREAGCALIAGETAEMPGIYAEGQLDVVGAIVGLVEEADIIDGRSIIPGDQLIGLPSSGPHTNGYSLIRKVLADVDLGHVFPEMSVPIGEAILEPHRSYLAEVRRMRRGVNIKGLIHLTGGGFYDNIPRVIPKSAGVLVRKDSWTVPPVFRVIQRLGDVSETEMYRVFNMGVGMIVVVSADELSHALTLAGPGAVHIGEVQARDGDPVKIA